MPDPDIKIIYWCYRCDEPIELGALTAHIREEHLNEHLTLKIDAMDAYSESKNVLAEHGVS